ncbi:pilin [Vibrio sinaloensis]|uniref:pilin n=1 Tax=Photobacterium sp. (strain ATCC 43367) TaxID=379097 RepID=UPI00057FFBA0|nr:pilin [Vibrio sinaloensis]KHT46449.1 pilus assembly protein PilA [Vibrio sinaloensis]
MKQTNNRKAKGFTLIELMIVVAIIGVLAAVAIPAYKNYVSKSEAASGLATMKALITPAELIYQENGSISTGISLATNLGISAGSNTLGTISVPSENTLKFEFNTSSSINGTTLTFTRGSDTGWGCANSNSAITLDGCP